jgi:hypothetical protein
MELVEGVAFIDSPARAKKHPDTWEAVSQADLADLSVGDYVKVGLEGYNETLSTDIALGGERFWVEITNINTRTITGTVQNELISYDLPVGTLIKFQRKHVIEVLTKEQMLHKHIQAMKENGASDEEIEQFITHNG